MLLADGAWLPDGTFRHLLYLDAAQVEKLFRADMRIVAFIVELSSLRRILDHLGCQRQRPEPLSRPPPHGAELAYAPT